jgi:predicted PurR-regulated permease PerM
MAVIALLAVGGIIVVGNILGFLQPVLVPLALAGILAYLLDPLVRRIRSKPFFKRELSRIQAVGLVFFLTVSAIGLVAFTVFLPAARQLTQLFDNKAEIISQAEKVFTNFNRQLVTIEGKFGFGAKPKDEEETGKAEPNEKDNAPAPPATDGETTSPFDAKPAVVAPAADETVPADVEEELKSQLWAEFLKWLQSPETGKAALGFVGHAANGFFGALGYIVGFFLVPVYLFFFLKDSASIRDGWARRRMNRCA